MPSRKPHLRLQDIVESARLIEAYTRGLSNEAFEGDSLGRGGHPLQPRADR